ncbi:hypothetical protein [Solemya pervernicosa gill symbiont]|nr:hypothetical protein [Solemya pervernicosa gill symbiont]
MGGEFVIQGYVGRDIYGSAPLSPHLYVYNPRLIQDNLPSRFNSMDHPGEGWQQMKALMSVHSVGIMRTTFSAINTDKSSRKNAAPVQVE